MKTLKFVFRTVFVSFLFGILITMIPNKGMVDLFGAPKNILTIFSFIMLAEAIFHFSNNIYNIRNKLK